VRLYIETRKGGVNAKLILHYFVCKRLSLRGMSFPKLGSLLLGRGGGYKFPTANALCYSVCDSFQLRYITMFAHNIFDLQ